MKPAPLAILLLSCGGPPQQPPRKRAPVAPAPVEPTEAKLRVQMDVEPAHLNPLLFPDEWCFRIALGPIYEPLFSVDAAGRAVPGGLAASVKEAPDRLSLEVGLRTGAAWHDGRAVSTPDVAFTYEAILDPRNGLEPLRRELQDLHMIELSASQPRTLRVRLHRVNTNLAAVMAEIPVMPRHVFASPNGKIDWARHPATRRPVGSGPYRLHEWKRGTRIVLRRAGENGRAPLLEIAFVVEQDGAEALAQLRRDEIDVLPRVLPVHYPDEALTPLVQRRFFEVRLRPARFALAVLNLRRAPLQDARVRRGLAGLVDAQALLVDVRRGLGRPIVVPGVPIEPLALDAAGATRLLDEAGLKRAKSDGPRLSGTRPWRLELLAAARAPSAEQQTRRIAADLGKEGITVTPRFLEQGDLFARLRRGTFDAAVLTFATRPDVDLGPLLGTNGASNHGGFSDAEVDRALDDIRREAPGAVRDAAKLRLGRRVRELQPVLFLYAVEEAALVRRSFEGWSAAGDWLDLTRVRVAATPPAGPAGPTGPAR